MSTIKLKGNEIHTNGELPEIGTVAPNFLLTTIDLSDKYLNQYFGKKVILNIFPSVDTAVCSMSVRKFNEGISAIDNAIVLCISRDLPFAQSRFCGAEGIKDVEMLSEMRDMQFGKDYGLRIVDGPMSGLLSRVVIVISSEGKVVYTEQVPDIVQEPDYQKAFDAARNCS
ncbi:MAG: thiol peroxidase [Candidatus Cloacimonetes bacterium]|nr:thiol peroxidase [Candidatus Cloacimonadota bacterium]